MYNFMRLFNLILTWKYFFVFPIVLTVWRAFSINHWLLNLLINNDLLLKILVSLVRFPLAPPIFLSLTKSVLPGSKRVREFLFPPPPACRAAVSVRRQCHCGRMLWIICRQIVCCQEMHFILRRVSVVCRAAYDTLEGTSEKRARRRQGYSRQIINLIIAVDS